MELKYKIMIFLGIGVLIIGSLFVFEKTSTEKDLCSWSQYNKPYKENGAIFCCEIPVDENGDYGFKENGERVLNKCEGKKDE